jgi:hypothetical protein
MPAESSRLPPALDEKPRSAEHPRSDAHAVPPAENCHKQCSKLPFFSQRTFMQCLGTRNPRSRISITVWTGTSTRLEKECAIELHRIDNEANAVGGYNSSKRLLLRARQIADKLDKTIDTVLGELERLRSSSALDETELRRIAHDKIRSLVDRFRHLSNFDKLQARDRAIISPHLKAFEKEIDLRLRQYDVGFHNPEEPELPPVTNNNINIGAMNNSAVQQGTSRSSQSNSVTLNLHEVTNALADFESAFLQLPIEDAQRKEILGDISTMKAQLEKAAPSPTVLQEVGRSIRNVTEGALGGALSPPLIAAAQTLWSALGL